MFPLFRRRSGRSGSPHEVRTTGSGGGFVLDEPPPLPAPTLKEILGYAPLSQLARPISSDEAHQYNQLAAEIGITARVDRHDTELESWLVDSCIAVYNLAKVEHYMDAKGYWNWFPMRSLDRGQYQINRKTQHVHPGLYGGFQDALYVEPIPLPVLLTTQSIIRHFGDRVMFFIAAQRTDPDPFIAAGLRGPSGPSQIFVLERWDEPSFRG